MNNLHRELAPVSDAAWAQIEEEAARTFKRHLAGPPGGRRAGPAGDDALRGRHRSRVARLDAARRGRAGPAARGRGRWSSCGCRSRWTGSRSTTWSAAPRTPTGSRSRTPPGRSPSPRTGRSSTGYPAGGIEGIRPASSNPPVSLPEDVRGTRRRSPRRSASCGGRRRRPVLGGAQRRRLHRGQRDQRPRLPGDRAHQAGWSRRHHLGAGHHRRDRADHPRRRLQPAARPGRRRSATCRTPTAEVELYLQETLTFLMYTGEAAVSLPAD